MNLFKKAIPVLLVALFIASFFAVASFASEPEGSWTIDWSYSVKEMTTHDQQANYNPVFTYYNCGSLFHDSWCSTEVSVPTNGWGYAWAQIRDDSGYTRAGDTSTVINSWIKVPAVYSSENGAYIVAFAGKQNVTELIQLKQRWFDE